MVRRVLMAILLLALTAGAVNLGAGAYFTDGEQNANNTFAAWTSIIVYLHPGAGTDETDGSYSLSGADLAALSASDGNRYTTQSGWDGPYANDEYLEVAFPDIPPGATVEQVTITVNWAWLSAETVNPEARLKVFRSASQSRNFDLMPPSSGYTDVTETVDVSDYVNTAERVNNLVVWFQANFKTPPPKPEWLSINTRHDLIEVMVEYY